MKKSLIEGLKILSFEKDTIKKVSREKNLEEIFLSTLFMNYLIVLIIYLVGVAIGGYSIGGREINMPVFFGLLMIYPFTFNICVYIIYGLFALFAEMINNSKRAHPILSVGFHTAFVYSIVILIVMAISSKLGFGYAAFVLSIFALWFLYTMFVSIHYVYEFSFPQTLIVLMMPFLLIGILMLFFGTFMPGLISKIILNLFI